MRYITDSKFCLSEQFYELKKLLGRCYYSLITHRLRSEYIERAKSIPQLLLP